MFMWSVNTKEYIQICCHHVAYFKAKMHQMGMAVNTSNFVQLIVPLRQSYLPTSQKKKSLKSFGLPRDDSQNKNEFRINGPTDRLSHVYLENGC